MEAGILVEVPSAVVIADKLAAEVDFLALLIDGMNFVSRKGAKTRSRSVAPWAKNLP